MGLTATVTALPCCRAHRHTTPHAAHLQGQQHIGCVEAGSGVGKGALHIQVVEQLTSRHPFLQVVSDWVSE